MCIYVWLIMIIKDSSDDEVFDDIVIHFFYDDGRIEIMEFNNVRYRSTLNTISGVVKALQCLSIPMYQTSFTVPSKKDVEELVFPLIDGH